MEGRDNLQTGARSPASSYPVVPGGPYTAQEIGIGLGGRTARTAGMGRQCMRTTRAVDGVASERRIRNKKAN